jgi:hypothetical protein
MVHRHRKVLTKTEIRVTIDSVEKQQKAIEILNRYSESIWDVKIAMDFDEDNNSLKFDNEEDANNWFVGDYDVNLTEITLEQLETILKNESVCI